ncbi:hypothetical protein [Methylibium sp. Pch-M]|uniref:hypothetical protein n=1 Tax=Methylibium sp. Pch-M TaxID=2082386 RepID=UPI001A92213E|nr:hypothetical protein [Methylibium sp. Pch-M]
MTEATTAPAAAPAASAPAAPAAAPVAAPAPTPAAAPVAAPAPAAQWFDNFQNADLKGWVQAAGVTGPESAAAKAHSLEKMLGADRAGRTVVLPADMNDAEAMGAVFDKLGRPANADAYVLDVPEGTDPAFSKVAAGWFHKAGLSQAQAKNISQAWNEHVAQEVQRQEAAEQTALQEEHKKLDVDWGTGEAAAMQREIARRAAVKLGLDEASIAALEKVVGFSKVMKAFAKVGELTGEAKAIGFGETTTSFHMTPEAAIARRTQLTADKEWAKRAMVANSAEWAELTKLNQVIAANQLKG